MSKNPFEIIRTQWNSSSHESNQNHNGKISKAGPATFKINVHSINTLEYHDSLASKTKIKWYHP